MDSKERLAIRFLSERCSGTSRRDLLTTGQPLLSVRGKTRPNVRYKPLQFSYQEPSIVRGARASINRTRSLYLNSPLIFHSTTRTSTRRYSVFDAIYHVTSRPMDPHRWNALAVIRPTFASDLSASRFTFCPAPVQNVRPSVPVAPNYPQAEDNHFCYISICRFNI